MTDLVDVAIAGAGPFGLSIASHLKAHGVGLRVFGPPMKTWLDMPASLNLKSFGFATNIYTPYEHTTLPEYCRARGLEDFEPIPMSSFAQYGLWVQQRLVPEVEPTMVTHVGRAGAAFDVTLATGERLKARRVVVAVGVTHFARVPDFFATLPPDLATHTSQHHTFDRFKGREVAVIGAGASAVEAAAMVREAGGRATLLVRGAAPIFHDRLNRDRSWIERIRAPISVLGPGRKSWALQVLPWAFPLLPEPRRVHITRGYLGPAGPWWLADRFHGKVEVRTDSEVMSADPRGGRLSLRLRERGADRVLEVDHLIAGTGYEPDADRLDFIAPELRRRLRRVVRAPVLSREFESSEPGLFFVGPVAAYDFGPLMRFVAGAEYASHVVARRLARDAEPGLRFARAAARPRAAGEAPNKAMAPLRD